VSDFEGEVESPSTTMSVSESSTPSPPSDGAQSSFPSSGAQVATSGGSGTAVPMEMRAHALTAGEGARNEDQKLGSSRNEGSGKGRMELALSPFTPVDLSGKRGRGRPRGSGKRQMLATLGTALFPCFSFLSFGRFCQCLEIVFKELSMRYLSLGFEISIDIDLLELV
jgi:hypothetical protein